MSSWTTRPIRELCSSIIDCVNKTAPVVDGPTPYKMIRTTNVRHGRVDLSNVRYVEEATYKTWVRRGKPRAGDIVLTREAPLGEVGMLRESSGVFLGQRLVMYRADPNCADRHFLLHAMRSAEVQSQISAYGSGSTVEHMRVPDCGELLIRCPGVPEQRRIGAVLAAFDDHIDLNDRRIELLGGLARSLYREWFVRFRLRGHPTTLVDSAVGQIPEGWTAASLFDVADVGFGHSFKSSGFSASGTHPVVRIRDVPKGETRTFTDERVEPRYMVRDGDILVGMDGEFHLNRWFGGVAWLNQRVARLRPLNGLSAGHLLQAVAGPLRVWNDTIVGTTVAHLGKRHLELIRVVLPPPTVLATVTRAFDAISEQELLLRRANQRLAATRDLLLPRLVTGRLDISDIDLGDLLPDADAA